MSNSQQGPLEAIQLCTQPHCSFSIRVSNTLWRMILKGYGEGKGLACAGGAARVPGGGCGRVPGGRINTGHLCNLP